MVKPDAIEVRLVEPEASKGGDSNGDNDEILNHHVSISVPWTAESFRAVKGILHAPAAAAFAEIAAREGKVERHIRLLAPLAFTSPRIITAIIDGTVPAALTVTGLAMGLPCSWEEQERRVGLAHP